MPDAASVSESQHLLSEADVGFILGLLDTVGKQGYEVDPLKERLVIAAKQVERMEQLQADKISLMSRVAQLQRERDDFEQRLHAYKSGEIV